MKRASVSLSFNQSQSLAVVVVDDTKAKLKYQTLLKEFLELQKECVSRKRKLQAAKLKRQTVLAEVRFLRRRHNFLSKSSAPNFEKDNSGIESNDALEQERNRSPSDHLPVTKSQVKDEEEKGNEQVIEEELRVAKNPINFLNHNKGVSKKKISWPDRGLTLKV